MSINENLGPIEYQAKQYYVHKSYVNSYYAMYKALESWITKYIFRNDKSRVFLASDDYAYRRRFELTDTSQDFETLDFSSLRFPFSNYWPQNSGWIPDDRVAAKQAALSYVGIYVGNTKLRCASAVLPIEVSFWFDREDDARLAYEILYFHSFNEHYYETTVNYGTDYTSSNGVSPTLKIPANIEITSLKFNPEFKESDWLKKQRVFVIKAQFDMRTFVIFPPYQPDYTVDANDTDYLDNYDDGIDFYYIVDDVILNFGHKNLKFFTRDAGYNESTGTFDGTNAFPETGEKGTVYIDDYDIPVELGTCSSKELESKTDMSIGDVWTVTSSEEGDKYKPNTKYIYHGSKWIEYSNTLPLNIYIWDEMSEKYVTPETNIDTIHIRYNGSYEESKIDITKFDFITNVTSTSNLIEWTYGPDTSMEDIEKIELHMTGMNDIIEIPTNVTSFKLDKLNSNSQYYGYIVFYAKDGATKKFIINFITKKKKTDSNKTLNSLVGYTW